MPDEKEKSILNRCKRAVKELEPSAEILLYGSRARGQSDLDSDYDLLIITEKDATVEREISFRDALFPVELDSGDVLTLMLVSRKEWESPLYAAIPFYRTVRKEGILL